MAETKEWTLMFYFASDSPPLTPEVVSQLKAIKQAGFHPDVNVIAQFDPSPENAETHIFDVNRINKIQAGGDSKIGFIARTHKDPFIVNLMTDKLWAEQTDIQGRLIRERLIRSLTDKGFQFDPPVPPLAARVNEAGIREELSPEESLRNFLTFCRTRYPARHYILFIVGHGLVVGNDTFLFDENAPEHSLQLRPLGEILDEFKEGIDKAAEFELISFHSCSMSSLEVAFELQGIANYMLASQSPSFVGSWPYRQILIRIFNYLERGEVDVKRLLKNIFHYCSYNTIDFLVAGYSGDACLCDLEKVPYIKDPLSDLSARLIDGLRLKDPLAREFIREHILLAHLDAQSYFNENYTDLYDFCFRLQKRFKAAYEESLPAELQAITEACGNVMRELEKGVEGDDDRLIVRSEFVGPAYQYSHGLSVYFPWSPPSNGRFWPIEYRDYKFVSAFAAAEKSWSDFLEAYFVDTRRRTRAEEFAKTKAPGFEIEIEPLSFQEELLEAIATGVFNNDGQLEKPGSDSSQGAGCDCQSIKNYPPFTRERVAGEEPGNIPVSPIYLRDPTYTLNGPSFALDGIE